MDIVNEINFICPITKQIFSNPVIADDGNIYEKDAITQWFDYNKKSPITREKMSKKLTSVNLLTAIIDDLIKNDPKLKEKQYISSKEFTKHKSEIYKFIKNNNFDELLNYHYYKCYDLERDTIKVKLYDNKKKQKKISYLHYIFRFCQKDNLLIHIIDNMISNSENYIKYMCMFSSESLILKYISESPLNFKFSTKYKWNALHFFAKRGFKNAMKLILEKVPHININKLTKNKYTPLMIAIKFKQQKIIKLLIKKLSSSSKFVNDNITFAIKYSMPFKMIKHMIDNCKLNDDILFHMFNDKKYVGAIDVIKYLIKFGVGLDYVNKNDDNILHIACKSKLSSNEIMTMLIQKNPSLINKKNKDDGTTPWMLALYHKKFKTFMYMEKYANFAIKSNINSGLVHFLAENANYNVFKHITDNYKLKFNKRNDIGKNALHYALKNGNNPQICEKLINECDVMIRNKYRKYPIHYALEYNKKFPNIIKQIIHKMDNLEVKYNGDLPIHYAAKFQNLEIIKLLIDRGANLESKSQHKQKPIHLICEHNAKDEIIKYMIDVKQVDIESVDTFGFRPLHYICWKGSIDLIKYMIEKTKDHSIDIETSRDKYDNLLQLLMKNDKFKNEIETYFGIIKN